MGYQAYVTAISGTVRDHMRGVTWHDDDPRCPAFEALALVSVTHWDMCGVEQVGEIVVAAPLGDDVARIFERLHQARFPIERMQRVAHYGGCDHRSMGANNTCGFNFRTIAGTDRLSLHALGAAIDINPVQNPFVGRQGVQPPMATSYIKRDHLRPGMIARSGPVVEAFEAFGWRWGGDWTSVKDYQHFSFDLPGAPPNTQ